MKLKATAVFVLSICAALAQPQEIRLGGDRQDYPGTSFSSDAAGNTYVPGNVDNPLKSSTFTVIKCSSAGAVQWSAFYAALPEEFSGGTSSVVTDSAGNVYAAGYIIRRVDSFSTNVDWLVVSFSSAGVQRWAHRFEGSSNNSFDSASQIALSPTGELYVIGISGASHRDWIVMKYSTDGAVLWQQKVAGIVAGDDAPTQMTFDAAGNLIVTGYTTNVPIIMRHDITVAKFSPLGALQWRRNFSDSDWGDDIPGGVAADISGNIYVTGTTALDPESATEPVLIKWDSNGNQLFVWKGDGWGGAAVTIDNAGDVVLAGTSVRDVGMPGITAVSKADAAGNRKWMTQVAASGPVATDFNGNIYVAGSAPNVGGSDLADFFAAKLTSVGTPIWQHRHAPGKFVNSGLLNGLGEWLVLGNAPSITGSFTDDILLLKFPASFVTPPPAPPSAPGNLTAVAGSKRITLNWVDQSANEDGFRIERCQGSGCTNFVQIAQAPANTTSFANTGLAGKTVYTYRVRAFNANGNSGYSNVASAKTSN